MTFCVGLTVRGVVVGVATGTTAALAAAGLALGFTAGMGPVTLCDNERNV